MGRNEVSTSVVKWSGVKVLVTGRLSLLEDTEIIYGCFVHHIVIFVWFYAVSLYVCMYGCMFCMLLFNFVNYIFILLCTCLFRSVYSVSLCCSVYCLRVNVHSTAVLCTVCV